jgi:hypothetical protein
VDEGGAVGDDAQEVADLREKREALGGAARQPCGVGKADSYGVRVAW